MICVLKVLIKKQQPTLLHGNLSIVLVQFSLTKNYSIKIKIDRCFSVHEMKTNISLQMARNWVRKSTQLDLGIRYGRNATVL